MQTPAMQCDPSPQTSIRASPTFSNVEISIPDRDWSQNIESRYAEIHQSIDSAFTVLAFFMQSSLHVHKVRQQNRTVFDKLIAFEKSLENGTLCASLRPTAVNLLEGDTNGLVKTPFSTVDEGLQLQDHPNADCIGLKVRDYPRKAQKIPSSDCWPNCRIFAAGVVHQVSKDSSPQGNCPGWQTRVLRHARSSANRQIKKAQRGLLWSPSNTTKAVQRAISTRNGTRRTASA